MIGLFFLGAAAVAAAVGVITARNPVHCVLWLIAHLLALAALFLTLQAEFVALIQVLVNAGAVMVLFLFVIGLLGPAKDTADLRARLGAPQGIISVLAALAFVGTVAAVAATGAPVAGAAPNGFGSVQAAGAALFGPQLLPFEMTALLLLVALVGVVSLALGRSRQG